MADFPSSAVDYFDTEFYELNGSFGGEVIDYIDFGAQSSGGSTPVVALVSPLVASVESAGAVVVDVTDADGNLGRVFVVARYPSTGKEELVHQGDRFTTEFNGMSSRAPIANGFRFTLKRSGGWPASPIIDVYAFDATGRET